MYPELPKLKLDEPETGDRLDVLAQVKLIMPRADIFDLIRAAEWVLYGPEEERESDGQSDKE